MRNLSSLEIRPSDSPTAESAMPLILVIKWCVEKKGTISNRKYPETGDHEHEKN
jgi:hypothetical protein